ncbi:MAG: hypothetical protein IJR58_07295 [Lachnospiraceae bacterium]|nr:hypothetical protein [Lachnospiraceae bacterium]
MSSRIEETIDEIEVFIDECKPSAFSHEKIIVQKSEMEALIRKLRANTPDEIKRYEKMLENKDAILADARAKAKALIDEATIHTNELINEHEIKRQAYEQANEVVTTAAKQAQEILDKATADANEMTASAVRYTDDLLAKVEDIVTRSLDAAGVHHNNFTKDMLMYQELIKSNRQDLIGAQDVKDETPKAPEGEVVQPKEYKPVKEAPVIRVAEGVEEDPLQLIL